MLTVIDPGSGMQPGIVHAIQRAGVGLEVDVSDDPGAIEAAEALVLPWTGPPAEAMASLEERDLTEPLRDLVRRQIPILGVGAGTLLLAETLADGSAGLGLLPGRVVAVPARTTVAGAPRTLTGWTPLQPAVSGDPLFDGVVPGAWFYYVAAWVLEPSAPHTDPAHEAPPGEPVTVVATSNSNGSTFPAVVRCDKVWGVLFEAARSGDAGLRVLANYARYVQSLRRARE